MQSVATWFLMLLPPVGQVGSPIYVKAFPDPVACQVRVIELRDIEPASRYECRKLSGPVDLSKPAQPAKPK